MLNYVHGNVSFFTIALVMPFPSVLLRANRISAFNQINTATSWSCARRDLRLYTLHNCSLSALKSL